MVRQKDPVVHLVAPTSRRTACEYMTDQVALTTSRVAEVTCKRCATALSRVNNRRR